MRYVAIHVACLLIMFSDGRLAMPLERRENVRHATLLSAPAGGKCVRDRRGEREEMTKNRILKCIAHVCAIAGLCASTGLAAEPAITVSAKQRYPWNGLVDLQFTITGDSGVKYDTSFTAKDVVGGTNITMKTIRKADGTVANATKEQLLPGNYHWVWDAAADLNVDSVTYDSFISTNSAVLFRNQTLAASTRCSVVFGGTSIPHVARRPIIVKADGAGKALQFQRNDGTWLKCVCVHLEQSGSDITGYVKWARYMSGAYDVGTDFDSNSYSTMRVAMSNEEGGYGIASLTLAYPNSRVGWYSDRVEITGTVNGTYSVKFNANGGTGTMANEPYTYGTAKVLMPNAFTRSGYTFQGWATSASGSKVYSDKQVVSNLTSTAGAVVNLYAVWEAALYMVIDLSGGANASSYPVSYLDAVPSGGWSDTYKTTKLVLRRIEPGTFKMGGQYKVTLTNPFYIGVFEVTQKQYLLVTGVNPVQSNWVGYGEKLPVYPVYSDIRGGTNGSLWPLTNKVDANSFMGMLRSRSGQEFDLPTEAQWEYACRAETTSLYNNGGNSESDLAKLARYYGNQVENPAVPAIPGKYLPNKWGLYDMHGNMFEFVLDWGGDLSGNVTDPKGPSTGTDRVKRGGGYFSYADKCTSSYRYYSTLGMLSSEYDFGFRICLPLQNDNK